MRTQRAVLVVLASALMAAAACTNNKPEVPSTTKPEGSNTPTATAGGLKTGTAHLAVTGSLTQTVDLPLEPAKTQFHGSSFAAFWQDPKNDLLSIGGPTFTGERKTDQGFVLGFNVVRGSEFGYATSSKGECTIKMTAAKSSIKGSFVCVKVKTGDKTYNASGTFSARA